MLEKEALYVPFFFLSVCLFVFFVRPDLQRLPRVVFKTAELKRGSWSDNSVPGQMFSGGPHTRLLKRLPCRCLSAKPFPDVLLLGRVSINVNVLWFVKNVWKGYAKSKFVTFSFLSVCLCVCVWEKKKPSKPRLMLTSESKTRKCLFFCRLGLIIVF